MSFSSLDILIGVRCDACVAWMRMPRKRRIRPAACEEPDISLIFHPTAEVLSKERDEWARARLDTMHSSAIQVITIPARSISLMVRVHALKISFIFCGHTSCQMIGPIFFRLDE